MASASGRATHWRPAVLAVFAVALAFTLVMALLPHPPNPLRAMGDKYQHMLAFTTLSLLAAYGFPGVRLVTIGERLSFVGALIEVAQALPVINRDCDLFDWVADTGAIAVTLALVALVEHLCRRKIEPAAEPRAADLT